MLDNLLTDIRKDTFELIHKLPTDIIKKIYTLPTNLIVEGGQQNQTDVLLEKTRYGISVYFYNHDYCNYRMTSIVTSEEKV